MSGPQHRKSWQPWATATILIAAALAAPRTAGGQSPPSIEFFVQKAPAVATGDKGGFLVYELTITNLTANLVTLRRVEVLDADRGGLYNSPFRFTEAALAATSAPVGGAALLTLTDSVLLSDISHPAGAGRGAAAGAGRATGGGRGADTSGRGAGAGRSASGAGRGPVGPPPDAGQLGAGLRLYVYLYVEVDRDHPPARLVHRLTFQRADSTTFFLEGALVPVERTVVAIGPPFRGEWVAVNGPGNISGHRRSRQTYDGRSVIGQRYAIDYVQIDSTGSTRRPNTDRANNENYYAWGQELLAVADGRIAATKDSIPSNVVGAGLAVAINPVTIGGNFVALDIGNGKYAMYAHVQPGSLRVKVGDRVKRGQVLALLGNSGNSSEPHLHFQISDGPSFIINSEGLPYATDFVITADCAGLGRGRCAPRSVPTTVKGGIPLQNELVRFPK